MPDLQVKIITTSSGTGAKDTVDELNKISKSAKDSASAFKELLGNREKAFAKEDAKAQAANLSDLTKQVKQVGVAAVEAERSKSKLAAAFKKLSHEVPIAGAAISALKNPFTVLTIAAAFAITKFREFAEKVDLAAEAMRKFEHGSITVKNFDRIIAETRANRRQFAEELGEIRNKAESADEMLSRLKATSARHFDVEEKRADQAKHGKLQAIEDAAKRGIITPEQADAAKAEVEAQAGRDADTRQGRAVRAQLTMVASAAGRTREDIKQAQFQERPAEIAVEEAKKRLDQTINLARAHGAAFDGDEGAILRKEREELQKSTVLPRGLFSPSKEKVSGRISEIDARLEVLRRAKEQSEALIVPRQTDVSVAEGRLERIRSRQTTGAESLRGFMREQQDLQEIAGEGSIPGGPRIATPAESGRYNAGIRMRGGTAATTSRLFTTEKNEIISAFRDVLKELATELRQVGEREMRDD